MICIHCEAATHDVPCACGKDPRLDGRYRLEEAIGQGAAGTTWRAVDEEGRVFAVKERLVRGQDADKRRELIEREARVLRQLSHAGIPAHHEALWTGAGKARHLYLVQEHVEGVDLKRLLETHRFTEAEVRDVTEQVLDVLAYLHGLSPPVLHRDVKPSNLIRRPDGRIALVDFGSVRDALVDADIGGSTATGTHGYAPPEQLVGDASPASDLYALAATAVHLLTRVPPHRLLGPDLRLRWRDDADVSPAFATWLDTWLEPDWTRRRGTATEARAALEARSSAQLPEAPPVQVRERGEDLFREAPPELPTQRPSATPMPGRMYAIGAILFVALSGAVLAAVGAATFVRRGAPEPAPGLTAAPPGIPADFVHTLPPLDGVAYPDQPVDCTVDITVEDGTSASVGVVDCPRRYFMPRGAMERAMRLTWPSTLDAVVRTTMPTPSAVLGLPDSPLTLPAAGVEVAIPGAEACELRLLATRDHLSSTCAPETEGAASMAMAGRWLGAWAEGGEVAVQVVPAEDGQNSVVSRWGLSAAAFAPVPEGDGIPVQRVAPHYPSGFSGDVRCTVTLAIADGVPEGLAVSGCPLDLHVPTAAALEQWRYASTVTGSLKVAVKFVQ